MGKKHKCVEFFPKHCDNQWVMGACAEYMHICKLNIMMINRQCQIQVGILILIQIKVIKHLVQKYYENS